MGIVIMDKYKGTEEEVRREIRKLIKEKSGQQEEMYLLLEKAAETEKISAKDRTNRRNISLREKL